MATKFGTKIGYNSACVRNFCEIFAPTGGFRGWAIECRQSHFSPTDIRCHGNEISDRIGYNSACVGDFGEIFCVGEFSEMGHQMLLTEFYPDRPLLPRQQNLRQNGLYLGLYNKHHQDR